MIDLTVTKDFIYDLKDDFTMNDKKDLYQFIDGDLVKAFYSKDDKVNFFVAYATFCKRKFKEVSLVIQKHYLLLKNESNNFYQI